MSWKKNVSVTKVTSNFMNKLKKKIGKKLESRKAIVSGSKRCRSLECNCITTVSDFMWQNDFGSDVIEDFKEVQLNNDASNICLTLLNFLMLDGNASRAANLELLFQESMNFLDAQRKPNEIMVNVFYPIYTTLFQPKYQTLKNNYNYTDPFVYDQRIDGTNAGAFIFYYDNNANTCYTDVQCKSTLVDLASTWEKVANIMTFDWKMGMGSMVSNFNYLMMMCSEKNWLQMEKMWTPNNKVFQPTCRMSKDAKAFYKMIQTITDLILNVTFDGIYLNDLIGYLGYSSTFELSSLNRDEYMYNTRKLHPIQGMDEWINSTEEGWQQCNYLSTYQNWVKHTSDLKEGRTNGK